MQVACWWQRPFVGVGSVGVGSVGSWMRVLRRRTWDLSVGLLDVGCLMWVA